MSVTPIFGIRRRQAGVSLVEALVALVVLSVGMLGIAGLYLQSLQSNRTAQTRTAAVHLVNDMGDRIRANHIGRASYTLTPVGTVPAVAAVNCRTANCTPAQLAAFDLRQWYDSATAALPVGPDGTAPQVGVTFAAGATTADPSRFIVTTRWKEPGSTDFLTTQIEVVQIGGGA